MYEQAPLRIMLVDDEDILIRLETRVMERLGHEVEGFTSAEEAAAAFQTNPDAYDLVVTDYSMPSMSGLELAEIVAEQAPGMPVVLVTGFVDMGGKPLPESIQKLLQKPFTVDQLREVLVEFSPRS